MPDSINSFADYYFHHSEDQHEESFRGLHEEKGSTRKEVIEAENDPSLYQMGGSFL